MALIYATLQPPPWCKATTRAAGLVGEMDEDNLRMRGKVSTPLRALSYTRWSKPSKKCELKLEHLEFYPGFYPRDPNFWTIWGCVGRGPTFIYASYPLQGENQNMGMLMCPPHHFHTHRCVKSKTWVLKIWHIIQSLIEIIFSLRDLYFTLYLCLEIHPLY